MSLWNHPRLTAALCTVAVLGCVAAPAVFLAAADAASLGRVETVADPYVAPTPTADDYYILLISCASWPPAAGTPRLSGSSAPPRF